MEFNQSISFSQIFFFQEIHPHNHFNIWMLSDYIKSILKIFHALKLQ